MPAIEARGLKKRYGKHYAVQDMSFTIEQGEVVGFLGPNGAGKTTTLRMLAGLIRPSSGSAYILDKRSPGSSLRSVGTMIEEPSFYPYMSGKANLRYTATLHGGVSEERIEQMLAFSQMDQAKNKKVKAYSQGMRQRLGLARALLWNPKVLLLDEPTNGLDPVGIAEFRESLREIAKQEGVTILISSHILAEIEKLVDRVLVIERGQLLFDGALHNLTSRLVGQSVNYQLLATDMDALEDSLMSMELLPERLSNGTMRVTVSGENTTFLSGLAIKGIHLLEASRETQDLEGAYLELLKEDGRPV